MWNTNVVKEDPEGVSDFYKVKDSEGNHVPRHWGKRFVVHTDGMRSKTETPWFILDRKTTGEQFQLTIHQLEDLIKLAYPSKIDRMGLAAKLGYWPTRLTI